ncbi:lysis protein [Methylophaga sp.]|uniref:lysis protein n=1 Tax=Methylophaga sp. TaxID=2024840 RepID=UPI003A8F1173
MPNIKLTAIAGVVSIFIIVILFSMYRIERADRIQYQSKLETANQTIQQQAELAQKQSERIKSFNELSIKAAEEVKSAKIKIDTLRGELRNNVKRVYVKASYPKPVPDTNTTGGVGDAGAARLSEAAREDYLRLREMMAESQQQVKYLQGYIRTQCL